ncbi:cysteine desulfurase [Bacteroidia bacterium]|nr:cysteine desulfurase [Bacteroidia bacterium]MDA9213894.1 cysteine desulfurase [Bacteroidia bacterium]
MENRIYLDNAATTPIDQAVVESMTEIMANHYGNPSSTHGHGRKVKNILEESRSKVAKLLGCKPSEIFFTSGGTEADNLALRGACEHMEIDAIISSPIEHHAVSHTVVEICEKKNIPLALVDIQADGHVNMTHLKELLLKYKHPLVSLMHANNEIGNMINIEAVGNLVHEHNGLFHCDTVQTMGHHTFDLSKGYVDFICAAAHKFNGPKGSGFLYISRQQKISPEITGGSQERDMRGGTENVYGIVGLTKALELSYERLEEKHRHISGLKDHMMKRLTTELEDIEFNGDPTGQSLYTVLSVSFPPKDVGSMLLFNLDIAGISASGGSACSSGAVGGSHVINHIKPGSDRTTIRFSFGPFNTMDDIDKTVEELKKWYGKNNQA